MEKTKCFRLLLAKGLEVEECCTACLSEGERRPGCNVFCRRSGVVFEEEDTHGRRWEEGYFASRSNPVRVLGCLQQVAWSDHLFAQASRSTPHLSTFTSFPSRTKLDHRTKKEGALLPRATRHRCLAHRIDPPGPPMTRTRVAIYHNVSGTSKHSSPQSPLINCNTATARARPRRAARQPRRRKWFSQAVRRRACGHVPAQGRGPRMDDRNVHGDHQSAAGTKQVRDMSRVGGVRIGKSFRWTSLVIANLPSVVLITVGLDRLIVVFFLFCLVRHVSRFVVFIVRFGSHRSLFRMRTASPPPPPIARR